jgi:hypothetical protein
MKSLAFKLDFNEYYKNNESTYYNRTTNYGDFMNDRRAGGSNGGEMDIEG